MHFEPLNLPSLAFESLNPNDQQASSADIKSCICSSELVRVVSPENHLVIRNGFPLSVCKNNHSFHARCILDYVVSGCKLNIIKYGDQRFTNLSEVPAELALLMPYQDQRRLEKNDHLHIETQCPLCREPMDRVKFSDLYKEQHYQSYSVSELVDRAIKRVSSRVQGEGGIHRQNLQRDLTDWKNNNSASFKGFTLMVNASVGGHIIEECSSPEEAKKKADQINRALSAQLTEKGKEIIDAKYTCVQARYQSDLEISEEHEEADTAEEGTVQHQQLINELNQQISNNATTIEVLQAQCEALEESFHSEKSVLLHTQKKLRERLIETKEELAHAKNELHVVKKELADTKNKLTKTGKRLTEATNEIENQRWLRKCVIAGGVAFVGAYMCACHMVLAFNQEKIDRGQLP